MLGVARFGVRLEGEERRSCSRIHGGMVIGAAVWTKEEDEVAARVLGAVWCSVLGEESGSCDGSTGLEKEEGTM